MTGSSTLEGILDVHAMEYPLRQKQMDCTTYHACRIMDCGRNSKSTETLRFQASTSCLPRKQDNYCGCLLER